MEQIFLPPRQRGVILHVIGSVLLAGISAGSMWLGVQQKVGSAFVLLLVLSILLVPLLIWMVYCGYALSQASYALNRDGLRIRWGLRSEDVPLPDIEWVRPADEMGFHMPVPFTRLPGAVLGTRVVEGLGPVEYIAADRAKMLLIATPKKVFAISPADARGFMRAFQRALEQGSPTPLASHTTMPVAFLQRVWIDRPARWMLLLGFALCAGLFVYVGMLIPGLHSVSLGFDGYGHPVEPGPPETFLLLPVLAGFAYLFDLLVGLFLYRREADRPVAYLIWASSTLAPALLFVAALFLAGVSS